MFEREDRVAEMNKERQNDREATIEMRVNPMRQRDLQCIIHIAVGRYIKMKNVLGFGFGGHLS